METDIVLFNSLKTLNTLIILQPANYSVFLMGIYVTVMQDSFVLNDSIRYQQ